MNTGPGRGIARNSSRHLNLSWPICSGHQTLSHIPLLSSGYRLLLSYLYIFFVFSNSLHRGNSKHILPNLWGFGHLQHLIECQSTIKTDNTLNTAHMDGVPKLKHLLPISIIQVSKVLDIQHLPHLYARQALSAGDFASPKGSPKIPSSHT